MRNIFVIEHLEPTIGKWCLIEYERISSIVGKDNLWFTNVKKDAKKLSKFGKVVKERASELNLSKVCVLDPQASEQLTSDDSKKFNYFVFGGILGDYPPKKRTKKELTSFFENASSRHIGKKQFSTDNAVYVSWKILNGAKLDSMKFVNKAVIKINEVESVILPFRYPFENGKAVMSSKIAEYLRKKKDF